MEPIGQKLKAAREKQKMTAADVAKAVRAKTEYITAIEKNEFHKLIAPIYARGFIKLYAQCVRLDYAPLLRQFDDGESSEEHPPARQEQKLQTRKVTPMPKKRRLVRVNLRGLMTAIGRIKLPDISRLKIPALKPVELPGKKWLALIIAAAFLIIILPIFVRHIASSDAKIQISPAGRWLADPPEPYLEIHPSGAITEGRVPAPKSQNSR